MSQTHFLPFPTLSTPHLILRQLFTDDAPALSALRSDPRINKYIIRPAQCTIDDANAFIVRINNDIAQGKCFYWAICLREKTRLAGTICLWNFSDDKKTAEIGYELNPQYHGQGLMNEAVNAVIDFSWDSLKLKKLVAFTHKKNNSSKKLLEKNGFKARLNSTDEKNPDFIIYSRSAAAGRQ